MSIKFDRRVAALQASSRSLERVVDLLASTLEQPKLWQFSDGHRGYRYDDPNLQHFCVIKGVRCVSGFNATIALLRGGFTQEIAVLIRGIIECTTQIDFAISGILTDGAPSAKSQKYVADFLRDSRRGAGELQKKAKVRQEEVHKVIAGETTKILGDNIGDFDSEATLGRVYAVYSNYVHARYPEVMDTFGGTPRRFHMRGMRGSPKDLEMVEVLEVYYVTIANCFSMMVRGLNIVPLIESDKIAGPWFAEQRRRAAEAW